MSYQFRSKVAVETKKKRGILQVLCLIGAVVLVVLNLILVAIDGFGELDIISGVALPIILLVGGLTKRTKIDYIPTDICIDLEDGKVIITYPALRRFVNGPVLCEKYEYTTKYTQMFQFSSELTAIRLYGYPLITIGGKLDDTLEDDREVVIYLPEDRAEEICAQFEKYLHKTLERMDN